MNSYRCGDVVVAEDRGAAGHKQKGRRYWLIVSYNIGNVHAPIYNAMPFTTRKKNRQPTHVSFLSGEGGLPKDSILLCELETPIEKEDCIQKVGSIPSSKMVEVAKAMAVAKPVVFLAFSVGFQDTDIFKKVSMA